MTRFGYPTSAMLGDYLRSFAGLAPVVALLVLSQVGTIGAIILWSLVALFGVFGARTALRHGTRVELNERGVAASGLWRATIAWADLDRMRLSYYSTRRDRRHGWMQLELRAGWTRLRLDSRLNGFPELVRRAAHAAATRGLELSETTVINLQALGVDPWDGEAL